MTNPLDDHREDTLKLGKDFLALLRARQQAVTLTTFCPRCNNVIEAGEPTMEIADERYHVWCGETVREGYDKNKGKDEQ